MKHILLSSILLFPLIPLAGQTSTETGLNEANWHQSDWYGWYNDTDAPQILHADHGWQIWVESGPDDLLVFDYGLNSYFWTSAVYYPLIFLFGNKEEWLLYGSDQRDDERWFYDPANKQWMPESALMAPTPIEPDPGTLQALISGRSNPRQALGLDSADGNSGDKAISPRQSVPGFSYIQAGSFMMGSPQSEPFHTWPESQHLVTLTRSYWMHQTEITNAQMAQVLNWAYQNSMILVGKSTVRNSIGDPQDLLMLSKPHCQIAWNGRSFLPVAGKEQHPCIEVTWYGAMAYCYFRTRMEGDLDQAIDPTDWSVEFSANGYRLPTEAEWEYACRARSTSAFADTDFPAIGWVTSENRIYKMAWFLENSFAPDAPMGLGRSTHPVGTKLPNAWGLHDMHGNVWEWCYDKFDKYPSGNVIDPTGPSRGYGRIGRGGAWNNPVQFSKSAIRSYPPPSRGAYHWGFRPVRTAVQ